MKENDKKVKQLAKEEKKKKDDEDKRLKKEKEKKEKDEKKKGSVRLDSDGNGNGSGTGSSGSKSLPSRNSIPSILNILSSSTDKPSSSDKPTTDSTPSTTSPHASDKAPSATSTTADKSTPITTDKPTTPTTNKQTEHQPKTPTTATTTTTTTTTTAATTTTTPQKRENTKAFDFWMQQDKVNKQDKEKKSPVPVRRVQEDDSSTVPSTPTPNNPSTNISTNISHSSNPSNPSPPTHVKELPPKSKPSPKPTRVDSSPPVTKHDSPSSSLKVHSSPVKRITPPPSKHVPADLSPSAEVGNRKDLVSSLASHMGKCVASMHKTVQVFLHPIYEAARKEPGLLEPCTKQGFSLYESMHGLNNVMKEDLDKSITSWSDATSLGPLFLKIVGYFKMYGQYAGQYNMMIAMINFLAFDNPRYEAIVKSGEQRMMTEFGYKTASIVELATNTRIIKPFQLRNVLSLGATSLPLLDNYDFYSFPTLLLAPICFIQTQATLLRALTLATPRNHTDYAQLNTALTRFEETISSILVEADVVYKTIFIQHTIRSSTIGLFGEPLPSRKLLKEGTLTEGSGTDKQSYMVFLFSDMVAFTDTPTPEGVHMLKRYEIVSDCKVSDPDLGFDNKKGFQLKTKDKTLMLYAQSEKEKNEWLNSFTKSQKTAVLTIKTSLEPEAERAQLSDFEAAVRDLKFGDGEKLELHSLKQEEGKELLTVLAGSPGLVQLSVSNSPALGERFIRGLSAWISTSSSLKHLTLSQVSLTSATAVVLSDALLTTVHISHLDLRGNSISDVGILAIAEAMIAIPRLSSFHLENNTFGEEGARAIASNLKHSHSLSVLGLEGNPIPSDVMVTYFADCVLSTLVTPLTVVTFDNAEFQKKIEIALTNNKLRKERQEAGSSSVSGSETRTIDMGYLGSGELNIQMLNKVNIYQGNRRLAEVSTIRLDHNSFTKVNEAVIGQLTGLHTLLAYYNDIREISLPIGFTNLSYLDLAHNRLGSIPPSIYTLPGLTYLDVSSNSISTVSGEIKALSKLSTLMLQVNCLSRFPKELLSVTTLTRLSIGGNSAIPITSQKILAAWAARVTKLDFSRSCISALPADVSVLTRITELDLSHNELKTIPPQIADLTNLKVLDISHNPLMESLPVQLWKLTNLQKINIDGNHSHMYDGPIKPNMETSALLASLKQQDSAKSMQPCNRLKIMLVGQENVGKTTLAKALKKGASKSKRAAAIAITTRLKEGALANLGMVLAPTSAPSTPTGASTGGSLASNAPAPNVSTDGIDMEEWDPEDDSAQRVSFTIWDFAGQEVYYATHAFFLSARSIFIVCFNMATGDDAAKVPYWLECIEAWGPGSPVIIVGTHLDEVSKDRADQWADEVRDRYMSRFPNIKKFIPISGKSAKNIGKLQKTVLKLGQEDDSVKKLYPRGLFQLEGVLASERALRQNTPPVITRAEFANMAKCCGLEDIPSALEELHRLGTLLYFRDTSSELADLVILDPKWLARLMATLITTKRAFVKLGILLHSQLEHIWRAPDFPPWLHPALLTMVQRFELCYPLPAKDSASLDQRFLVPSLLPDTKPAALSSLVLASLYSTTPTPATSTSSPDGAAVKTTSPPQPKALLSFSGAPLVRLYQFKFLPFGFFSRLMIRVMNFLEPVHYWKTGIVLHKGDNQVCIEYRTHNHTIIVQVWGSQAATYWRYIRESIAVLFDGWYKRLSFQISIPCLCAGCMIDKSTSTPTSSPVAPLRTSGSGGMRSNSDKNSGGSTFFTSPLANSHSANGPAPTTNALQTSSSLPAGAEGAPPTHDSSAPQQENDNLSDAEDESTNKEKKGKFQTLRKSFRVMVNHRQKTEPATTVAASTPSPAHTQAPKDDFAECHTFSYAQCEESVMSSQKTILCPKSQTNISLDSIVPELTMIDLTKFYVKFSEIEMIEKVAEGGFGAVFKAKLNGSLVAVKQLIEDAHEDAMAAYREFWREVFMSSILTHKCIVSLKAFTMIPCCMVMEFMPNGDLYSYLHSPRNDLTWQSKLRIAINIADAMAFLHSQKPKICHRDLKSPNILMADKSDPEVLCKISDFGESRLVATSGQGRQNLANPLWLAPEVMRGGEYSEKCDVYSFGIIMWELITAAEPFDEFPVAHSGFMSRLEDEIIAGLRPTIPASCNSEYRALVEAAWDADPDQRPTFAALHSSLMSIRNTKFNTLRKN